jgi:hypothetical protein
MRGLILSALLLLIRAQTLLAAIGCTLSNPAPDLKYLYPAMTSYREESHDLATKPDGQKLFEALKSRLGSDLDPVYETFDTPYTVYTVFDQERTIGIVHGVNVPGQGGVIQVFLATDPGSGTIERFFFQRLESPAGRALKGKAFRAQFSGLTLADFYKHDYYRKADPTNPANRIMNIRDPGAGRDFHASLRGVRKNLILLDLFVYGQQSESYYERAQTALRASTRQNPRK